MTPAVDPMARLTAHLEAVARVPFAWGRHDCLTFTNAARTALHGRPWAADLEGCYLTPRGRVRRPSAIRRAAGAETLRAALDARLRAVPHVPPRGAVVLTEAHVDPRWPGRQALGIAFGREAAFVGPEGLLWLPLDAIVGAWD